MTHINPGPAAQGSPRRLSNWLPPAPLFLIQPVLARIVKKIAADNPDMFGRLGPHVDATFVIDPENLPFAIVLRPDPDNLMMRAYPRNKLPPHDARVSGGFLDLLMLVDGDLDGDALFFARDLTISGNTEAVVCLRNALDDVDGSIAEKVANMFGRPGRAALAALQRASHRNGTAEGNNK